MFVLVFVTSCLLLSAASGQEDLACSALGVEREDDVTLSGADLGVCAVEKLQCCTQQFLDRVRARAGSDLLQGLKDQVQSRINIIRDILSSFSDFFEGEFIANIRSNIPAAALLTSHIDDITSALSTLLQRANLAISSLSPDVSTTDIFEGILSRIREVIRNIPGLDTNHKECLVRELDAHLNSTAIGVLGRTLETVRRSFSSLTRIFAFLEDFATNLGGFVAKNFPDQCVERLVQISFCGRCTGTIPPLCSNSCGALVRGCFAGVYTGLRGEFDNLWMVVRQLVGAIANSVRELYSAEEGLLDINVIQVATNCEINLLDFLGRRKRQVSTDVLPSSIGDFAEGLIGLFVYGADGPLFCRPETTEQEFCVGRGTEDRTCGALEVCTRSCQCWDGSQMRENDIAEFTGLGIEDQANNPVISLSDEENTKVAEFFSTPVSAFLTSEEFTEVIPEGVTVPPPAPFGSDGSAPLVVSMVTVLGTLLMALVCA